MTYNNESHIKSFEDIKTFFHHFVDERKVNFHPDDDFADYICYDDKTPTFSKEDVGIYNWLMGEAFDVCETEGVDIYDIGFDELSRELGLN